MRRNALLLTLMLLASCGQKESIKLIPGPQGPAGANGHSLVSYSAEIDCETLCPNGGTSLDIYLDLDDSQNFSGEEVDSYQNSIIICNGENGLDGSNGLDGAQGAQGEVGERGPRGFMGFMGFPGLPGPRGLTGATGPAGPAGAQGPAGTPGSQGPVGPAGTPGAPGAAGINGLPGAAGTSSVTISAYSSSSCVSVVGSSPARYAKSGELYESDNNGGTDCDDKIEIGDGDTLWLATRVLATQEKNGSSYSLRVITFN
jgi:hypothetical protein